ncbi:probable indole-3-pyruvate monooxygenase YUCCA10 [Eucalyptus grandis]|uniref:probable indole-3-pyruvate monooxygenase YUCCA10 n=1 Tax=Eucalyptus grandis TaxID=71139 RepID=UPI00192EF835|nr:probable indole-3-pyruvate monooxygenase YUCCA10 [Eucalyptus grandis]
MRSSYYRNRREFRGSNVLVVGCGNSGMEIAYDLWSHGANTSIVTRSPYGLRRPEKGPFYLKAATGRSPAIDVRAMKRIDDGVIKGFEIPAVVVDTAFGEGAIDSPDGAVENSAPPELVESEGSVNAFD